VNAALARAPAHLNQRRAALLALALLAIAPALAFVASGVPALPLHQLARPARSGDIARQPVFVENQGQVQGPAQFYARTGAATFFFGRQTVTVALEGGPAGGHALRIALVDAATAAPIRSLGRAPGTVNTFIGGDQRRWVTNAPAHTGIEYAELWPGISLRYVAAGGVIESIYDVAPGADPGRIALRYEGADRLLIDDRGYLIAQTPLGELTESAPIAFQQDGDERVRVDARYVLLDATTAGLRIGRYDRRLPLVIDPSLVYSTFLGGSGTDQVNAVAVDGAGNAYVAGLTTSLNFPTVVGSYRTTSVGGRDAFVTKLSPTGALVYSTYIGGAGLDEGNGIDLDASGNAYLTGVTASTNFPTLNAFQSVAGGADDVFVTKLNAAGSAILYSTYLGGSDDDEGLGITVDGANSAYVTGTTFSSNFDTLNAYQPALVDFDAFVTKLSATGSALTYSTYLGGTALDEGFAIAVDGAGSAYVTGSTFATDFPTANAFRPASGGGRDGFVTKLSAAGAALSYSTYLGGSGSDYGSGVAVDASGNAYVAGLTASTNFPTASALQPANAGSDDAFVTKLSAAGTSATYSTYVGGSSGDGAGAISLAPDNSPVVTGSTFSSNFPTAAATQGPGGGGSDAFVTKLTSAGSSYAFSTYLGGGGGDRGWGVAAVGSDQVLVAGSTFSSNFPVNAAAQPGYGGTGDGFVTRVNLAGGGSVGGIAELPHIGGRAAANARERSGPSAPALGAAGLFVAFVAVSAAWYVRRRLRAG